MMLSVNLLIGQFSSTCRQPVSSSHTVKPNQGLGKFFLSLRFIRCFRKTFSEISFELVFFFNVASNSTGYDCGIYVICVAEELCKNFLASKETSLKDTVTAENIQQKRRELKKLILDLGRTKT